MIITGNRILDAQFKPSHFRFEGEDEDEKRDPRETIAAT